MWGVAPINMKIRLQKWLMRAGVASRRKSEELIAEGRVCVNGEIAVLGMNAAITDDITLDGVPVDIGRDIPKRYIMLNKPVGVISTAKDQFGRPTVMDFVPNDIRLFPVGRLDYHTSGLIFLTNDGEWANNLMHPSQEIEKTYIAEIDGKPSFDKLEVFREGLLIEEKLTAQCKIKIINESAKNCTAEIIIHEGRNRQVRKMCEAIGHPVLSLKRIKIGDIELGDLPVGKWQDIFLDNAIRLNYD